MGKLDDMDDIIIDELSGIDENINQIRLTRMKFGDMVKIEQHNI